MPPAKTRRWRVVAVVTIYVALALGAGAATAVLVTEQVKSVRSQPVRPVDGEVSFFSTAPVPVESTCTITLALRRTNEWTCETGIRWDAGQDWKDNSVTGRIPETLPADFAVVATGPDVQLVDFGKADIATVMRSKIEVKDRIVGTASHLEYEDEDGEHRGPPQPYQAIWAHVDDVHECTGFIIYTPDDANEDGIPFFSECVLKYTVRMPSDSVGLTGSTLSFTSPEVALDYGRVWDASLAVRDKMPDYTEAYAGTDLGGREIWLDWSLYVDGLSVVGGWVPTYFSPAPSAKFGTMTEPVWQHNRQVGTGLTISGSGMTPRPDESQKVYGLGVIVGMLASVCAASIFELLRMLHEHWLKPTR